MRNNTGWQPALILWVWIIAQCAMVGNTYATDNAIPETEPIIEIAAMSDEGIQGTACLVAAAASMTAAYALGPTELLMLASGAMHIPSGSAVLFIPLFSILGGGSCALAATATPSVRWLISQSDEIAAQVTAKVSGWFNTVSDATTQAIATVHTAMPSARKTAAALPSIRPMSEPELQSTGCVVGALSGLGAAIASSPTEVAMLSSGATMVVSSTPLLGLGLLATIVGASCGIGSFTAVPLVEFVNNFDAIGNSVFTTIEQGLTWLLYSDAHPVTVLTPQTFPTQIAGSNAP